MSLPNGKMINSIDWIFPHLRHPSRLWNIASTITVMAVGIFSKILIKWLNKTKVHNRNIIAEALDSRPKHVPLITLSNHYSCFDDPGIWGSLKWRHIMSRSKIRWSLAAHDICFTCSLHSYFFSLGKCVPVIRGGGVYQKAVDFCIERLALGDWVHVFPEGKVNMAKETIRWKWGVGRMIYEAPVTPMIVPIWHVGMDEVLPNEPPYMLHSRKVITFNYGEPIDVGPILDDLKSRQVDETVARKEITDFLQAQMGKLQRETEDLHNKRLLSIR